MTVPCQQAATLRLGGRRFQLAGLNWVKWEETAYQKHFSKEDAEVRRRHNTAEQLTCLASSMC